MDEHKTLYSLFFASLKCGSWDDAIEQGEKLCDILRQNPGVLSCEERLFFYAGLGFAYKAVPEHDAKIAGGMWFGKNSVDYFKKALECAHKLPVYLVSPRRKNLSSIDLKVINLFNEDSIKTRQSLIDMLSDALKTAEASNISFCHYHSYHEI
ncbi:MAG: hypothetical protein QXK37_04075 [Candidatus Woesearchaeota archaeon]